MIPTIESCLVCDFVRPELNGKLIILGFFGICPNVDVAISQLDQPTALTFVFSGTSGEGLIDLQFDVLDEVESRVVASTSPQAFQASPKATVLAPTLLLVFGHAGRFAVRCHMNGSERFRAHFAVSQGASK